MSIRSSQSQFMRRLANSGLVRPSWCESAWDKRLSQRQPVAIDAVIHQAKRESVSVTLLDFAHGGCSLSSSGAFRIDEPFFLHIDAMEPIRAHVIWKDEMRYGCKFDRPIHDAVARHLIENLSRKDNRRDHSSRMGHLKTTISP